MKSNRRTFLGLLGAAPVAGKAVAAEMLPTAGFGKSIGSLPISGITRDDECKAIAGETSYKSKEDYYTEKLNRALQDKALVMSPEFREYKLIEAKRFVKSHFMDPDLQSYRSFSLVTKMRIQTQRRVEESVQQTIEEVEVDIWEAKNPGTGVYGWKRMLSVFWGKIT